MFKFVELEQGSAEWLAFRRNRVMASDLPSIMGVGFDTPHECYMKKMNGIETADNEHMRKGRDNEPIARKLFEEKVGFLFSPAVVISLENYWMGASLDGINQERKEILEIKCPGKRGHDEAVRGGIPEKYWPQVQWQLAVTGYCEGYYVSYYEGEIVVLEFSRDDEYIDKLIKEADLFYERIVNFDPPEAPFVQMKQDDSWTRDEEIITEADRIISEAEERKEAAKKRLIEKAAGRNCIGRRLKLQKVIRKGNIDYTILPHLKGLNLEAWRKSPSESWRLTAC